MEAYFMNNKIKTVLIFLLGLSSTGFIFSCYRKENSCGDRKKGRLAHSEIIQMKLDIIEVVKQMVIATKNKDSVKVKELDKKRSDLYRQLQANGCERFLKTTLEDEENKMTSSKSSWSSMVAHHAGNHMAHLAVTTAAPFILKAAARRCGCVIL